MCENLFREILLNIKGQYFSKGSFLQPDEETRKSFFCLHCIIYLTQKFENHSKLKDLFTKDEFS